MEAVWAKAGRKEAEGKAAAARPTAPSTATPHASRLTERSHTPVSSPTLAKSAGGTAARGAEHPAEAKADGSDIIAVSEDEWLSMVEAHWRRTYSRARIDEDIASAPPAPPKHEISTLIEIEDEEEEEDGDDEGACVEDGDGGECGVGGKASEAGEALVGMPQEGAQAAAPKQGVDKEGGSNVRNNVARAPTEVPLPMLDQVVSGTEVVVLDDDEDNDDENYHNTVGGEENDAGAEFKRALDEIPEGDGVDIPAIAHAQTAAAEKSRMVSTAKGQLAKRPATTHLPAMAKLPGVSACATMPGLTKQFRPTMPVAKAPLAKTNVAEAGSGAAVVGLRPPAAQTGTAKTGPQQSPSAKCGAAKAGLQPATAAKAGVDPAIPQQYRVDNSILQARTHGLGYRFSKRGEDIDKTSTAPWGTTVVGIDQGDGWLQVGEKYLPMKSCGKPVLTPAPKVALARTTSSTFFAPRPKLPLPQGTLALPVLRAFAPGGQVPRPHATAPKAAGAMAMGDPPQQAGGLRRTASGALAPAGLFVPRSPAPTCHSQQQAGGLRRQASGALAPAGLFVPRSPAPAADPEQQALGLKRQNSNDSGTWPHQSTGSQPPAKRPKQAEGMDTEGRKFDLKQIVVNFANVGATYACRVLGRDKAKGDRLFDWEGVRRCVRHLTNELGLDVIGVVMENLWGPDNNKDYKIGIPDDIRKMCDSIEETPKLVGRNHKSADDEMTIKCAYRRNCRFMDNDNYRDWIKEMRNDRCRSWLEHCQETLQLRYFFDSQLGTFDTLDGSIQAGLSSPGR